ncbi:A disintegrin and metalloproteinase with thrombospondin motifs 18-like isoform X1 [Haemaphysalis longicornis]
MRLCAFVDVILVLLTAASFLGPRAASSASAGKPNSQASQLEAQFINQVIAKVEKLLMVGSGNTEALQYEVFEPHVDLRPSTRKRRRKRRRWRRQLDEGGGADSADLSLELPAFGQMLRLDLGQSEDLISSQFQLLEEDGAANGTTARTRRRRDVDGASPRLNVPDASCFYQGRVRGVTQSKAALSVCSGLRGLIELPDATFFVYPLYPLGQRQAASGEFTNSSSSPHIVARADTHRPLHCGQGEHRSAMHDATRRPPRVPDGDWKARRRRRRRNRRRVSASAANSSGAKGNRRGRNPPREGYAKGAEALVETAVFVDQALYRAMARAFPGGDPEQELITYVLTIMNAVQMLFKHESLGRNIDVTVVELEILKLQPRDLTPSENIDTYLTNFCVWQHQRRKAASAQGTPRWDHALLLSGINMFVVDEKGLRKRHVVGLAPVSGMCNSLNSCTISEGTSFQSVYVASHEMGHSLGMEHDGSQDGNPCDVDNYVMSPTLGAGKTSWSTCSRQYVSKFLRLPAAACVFQRGSRDADVDLLAARKSPQLPGEIFSADRQCVLRFGSASRRTATQPLQEICRMLRCEMSRGITPVSFAAHPALEGTPCAENMWCRGGYCVARRDELERRRSRDPPVDGGWGPWSSFGSCRSDCVARGDYAYVGVKVSRRRCDRPSPQNGGRFCEGSDKRVQICDATQLCTSSKSQRLLDDFVLGICRQASARDKAIEPYGTQFPSRDYTHSCYVWCRKRGGGYMTHGWRIPDGTPCWSLSQRRQARNTNRYCVDGECQAFDCYGRSTEDDSAEATCPVRQSPLMAASSASSHNGGLPYQPSGWGPWHAVSECRHSCLAGGSGFQLVARECNAISRCVGKKETYKLCDSTRKCRGLVSADQYATKVCEKYRRKYVSLLSGRGRQLPLQQGNPHVSCVVACQDRVWKDTHYQMDVFDEGRFPFGTDCSGGRGRAFCVSGRCQAFTEEGTPQDEDSVTPRALQRRRRRRRIKRSSLPSGNGTTLVAIEEGDVRWEEEWKDDGRLLPRTQSNETLDASYSLWKILMSDCSHMCGGGIRNVTVQCEARDNHGNGSRCDERRKPTLKTGSVACNTDPCTGRWHVEPWRGTCSASSSSSPAQGVQSRLVVCVEPLAPPLFSLVPDGRCPRPRPPSLRKCALLAPPPQPAPPAGTALPAAS